MDRHRGVALLTYWNPVLIHARKATKTDTVVGTVDGTAIVAGIESTLQSIEVWTEPLFCVLQPRLLEMKASLQNRHT